jgi:hypothetical protein
MLVKIGAQPAEGATLPPLFDGGRVVICQAIVRCAGDGGAVAVYAADVILLRHPSPLRLVVSAVAAVERLIAGPLAIRRELHVAGHDTNHATSAQNSSAPRPYGMIAILRSVMGSPAVARADHIGLGCISIGSEALYR